MEEREITDYQDGWFVPPCSRACAQSAGDNSVDTVGAAIAHDVYALSGAVEEGIQVAYRHAVAHVERRIIH